VLDGSLFNLLRALYAQGQASYSVRKIRFVKEKGGSCFHRVRPKGIAARCINNDVRGQRKGMEMVERKKKRKEEEKKKKKKKNVNYVLTIEQQRTGTHFPRKRPYSL
jgi:hypothetical protein